MGSPSTGADFASMSDLKRVLPNGGYLPRGPLWKGAMSVVAKEHKPISSGLQRTMDRSHTLG